MRKFYPFYILLFCIFSFGAASLSAQPRIGCEDFNSGSQGNWVGSGVAVTIPASGPSGLPSDLYLRGRDLSGPSILANTVDYVGDWTTLLGHCLCFDFRLFEDGTGTTPIAPRITIRDAGGTVAATFLANFTVNEGDPWVNICAPIELCTNGVLPSNAQGSWQMNTTNPCQDFNNLLANVGQVTISFDFTSMPSEEVGYDNICIDHCADEEGAFCCDSITNLITNGTFEAGNTGFTSQYDYQSVLSFSSVLPGQYTVAEAGVGREICENWFVEDHSRCAGLDNSQVMFVNGRTQQAGSSTSIWSQTINGLEEGREYKFCGHFKNLPSCCFDVIPRVTIRFSTGEIFSAGINTAADDPCDWQEISGTITASNPSVTIDIILDESGNGDGNDLAIDDLAFFELEPVTPALTVQHQSNPQVVTASINTLSTGDDVLPDRGCEYQWTVAEVISVNPLVIDWGTAAFGNGSSTNPWNLTTTFPGYTFNPGTLYYIALDIFNCDCHGMGSNYQLTYVDEGGMIAVGGRDIREEELLLMMDRITDADVRNLQESIQRHYNLLNHNQQHNQTGHDSHSAIQAPESHITVEASPLIQFSPNPTDGLLRIRTEAGYTELKFCDIHGKVLETWTLEEESEFDISKYASGTYLIRYMGEGLNGVEKVILR